MDAANLNPWLIDPNRRPLVMGVLNVTPDSFSDGGKYATPQAALDHALQSIAAGADCLDIGGESTRPGALPVPPDEQIRRIQPVIAALRKQSPILLSIDTRNWSVAQVALAEGANLVNDISAGDDPAMFPGVAKAQAPIILMHMRGTPLTMQQNPTYQNVTTDVGGFLTARLAAAQAAGIDTHRVLFDPGIGFGKTAEHSLTLLRDIPALVALGRPVVIGASRKSFIGKVLSEPDPLRRVFGDAAVISWAIANGAAIVRVHEVGSMRQVTRVIRAIQEGRV